LGCPQECASRENFGAFLVERNEDGAVDCIRAMRDAIDDYMYCVVGDHNRSDLTHRQWPRPRLSAKMRLLEHTHDSIAFAKRLQDAGCDCVAVHCRKRSDKHDGMADWKAGAAIVAALDVPVVLNGGIGNVNEARSVMELTKCHAVMVARGYLENHGLFFRSRSSTTTTVAAAAQLAAEYLDYADRYPPPCYLYIQKHLRWIFRSELQPADPTNVNYSDWRPRLWGFLVRPYLRTIAQFRLVVALYVKLSGDGDGDGVRAPESIQHLVNDVTFKSVRKAATSASMSG